MQTMQNNAEFGLNYKAALWNDYNLGNGGNPEFDSYTWFVVMVLSGWNYMYDDNWRVPYGTFKGSNMNEEIHDGILCLQQEADTHERRNFSRWAARNQGTIVA